MKQFLFLLAFLFVFNGCVKKPVKSIDFPKLILSSYDTIRLIDTDKMSVSKPSLYGINVIDSLDFKLKRKYISTNFSEDYYNDKIKNQDSILVFVDTSNVDFHSNEIGPFVFLPPPPPIN